MDYKLLIELVAQDRANIISLARRYGVMKILSYRRQIIADHSSTNYLFYSPKPLTKEARAIISKLSSHVDVRAHTAEITYHGDFADLGEDRRKKFLQHYDVEVQESYDWWSMSIMLDIDRLADPKKVMEHEEEGGEATLTFDKIGKRLRLRLQGCSHLFQGFGDRSKQQIVHHGLVVQSNRV